MPILTEQQIKYTIDIAKENFGEFLMEVFRIPSLNNATREELDIIKIILTHPDIKELPIFENLFSPLYAACGHENIPLVKFLLTEVKVTSQPNINSEDIMGGTPFLEALRTGNAELIQYLITSPEIEHRADFDLIPEGYDMIPLLANSLDMVKHITITSEVGYQSLKNKEEEFFLSACKVGNLDVVKYLLTSQEVKNHPDIHTKEDQAIVFSCTSGNIELVEYLLFSKELKTHCNIHAQKDNAFNLTCEEYVKNKNLKKQRKLIDYLIYEVEIEQTIFIKEYIDCNEEYKGLFEKRNFNNKLNKELLINENSNKRPKI